MTELVAHARAAMTLGLLDAAALDAAFWRRHYQRDPELPTVEWHPPAPRSRLNVPPTSRVIAMRELHDAVVEIGGTRRRLRVLDA